VGAGVGANEATPSACALLLVQLVARQSTGPALELLQSLPDGWLVDSTETSQACHELLHERHVAGSMRA
jgi:hypothetical protein